MKCLLLPAHLQNTSHCARFQIFRFATPFDFYLSEHRKKINKITSELWWFFEMYHYRAEHLLGIIRGGRIKTETIKSKFGKVNEIHEKNKRAVEKGISDLEDIESSRCVGDGLFLHQDLDVSWTPFNDSSEEALKAATRSSRA
jgi:hypothetical protein